MSEEKCKHPNKVRHHSAYEWCPDCMHHLPNETQLKTYNEKWFTERGAIWRTLENKRLRMEKNGHNTKPVISRVPTEEDEREYEFWHQLPKGNPNLLPSLPKEYVK